MDAEMIPDRVGDKVQHDKTKKYGFPLEFTLNLIGGGNDKAFVSGKA